MVKSEDLVAGCQQSLDEEWGYIWGKIHEMWSDEKQDAYVRAYHDDERRKQSCEYGGKWAGHIVTDCSGLVKYWVEKYGGKMYHGSNTMYLKWCTSKGELRNGQRTDGKPLKPGTAVFCWNGAKYSHVGINVGGGWVIEAAGTRQGVIKSRITDSKWDNWGELRGVDYTGSGDSPATDLDPIPVPRPTIKRGAKGETVKIMQKALLSHGYDVGPYGADGVFGRATEEAVKKFQQSHTDAEGNYLVIDGICGPKTWAALERETVTTYTITISGITKDQAGELLKMYPTADVAIEGR